LEFFNIFVFECCKAQIRWLVDKVDVSDFCVTESEVRRKPRQDEGKAIQDGSVGLSDDAKRQCESLRWQSLAVWNFSQRGFGLEGSRFLAALDVGSYAKLEEMQLCSCQLGNLGVQMILDAIPSWTPLRILALDDNDLERCNWSELLRLELLEELWPKTNWGRDVWI